MVTKMESTASSQLAYLVGTKWRALSVTLVTTFCITYAVALRNIVITGVILADIENSLGHTMSIGINGTITSIGITTLLKCKFMEWFRGNVEQDRLQIRHYVSERVRP